MSTVNPKTVAFTTVRYVVMSILNRLNDYSLKSYKRMVQIAIEGFTELSLYHLASLETVYFHMSTAKTINLPPDFVNYTKIGFPINGKLRVISRNDNILLPRNYDDTGLPVGNADDGIASDATTTSSDIVFFQDHWRNGQFVGGMYGLSGGVDDAYYRIDWERRQIVFSGITPRSEIILEYISSGIKEAGGTMIPREAIPALRTYVLWAMIENDQRVAWNEKERRKREHEEAVQALRFMQSSFTGEEYKRMLYSQSRQSPRR